MRHDPTNEDMIEYLSEFDCSNYEMAEAIYWYAAEHHTGQWSNLYAAMSASPYRPSSLASGPEDMYLYHMLCAEYNGT